jgi:hypothetical protein
MLTQKLKTQKAETKPSRSPGTATRITAKIDVGFGNALYIRGKGANLSWDKGLEMKNVKPDEWVWECNDSSFSGEFKVLINDAQYEMGDNHRIKQGAHFQYSPQF